ncbi:MAG: tetratricopeptide repeat protein [Candidatus Heimdallarchaeota archaeon]
MSVEVTDEKIMAYLEEFHEMSMDGCLIREKYLTGEKWALIEHQAKERLQEEPGDAFTMDALGHHYLHRKQYQEAFAMYEQALECCSQPATIQHPIAVGYYRQGDIKQALEEFRKIDQNQLQQEGRLTIDWSEYDYLDGDAYVEIRPPPMSEEEQFEEARQFTIRTLMHNAKMYTQMSAFEIAIECYQDILQFMPKAPCVMNSLGVVYGHAKMFKEAKKIFAEAIRYNPGLDNTYFNLAYAHSELGEYELAVGVLKKATKKFQDNPETWLELSKAYLNLNHQQKAIDCLVKALEENIQQSFDLSTIPELEPILKMAYKQFAVQKN